MSNLTSTQMYPLVESWLSESQSKADFCAERQLNIHTFNYWLKKYRGEPKKPSALPQKSDFIALQISPSKESGVEISYPNGVEIRLRGEVKITDLQYLIQMAV